MNYIPEGLECARSVHSDEEGWPNAALLRYGAGWCSEEGAERAGDVDTARGQYEYRLALTTEGIRYALTVAEIWHPAMNKERYERHRLLLDAVIEYLKEEEDD